MIADTESPRSLPADLLPRQAIVSYDDWRAFCLAPQPVRPSVISIEDYDALSGTARRSYNAARTSYHAQFGPLETPQMQRVLEDTLRLARLNYRAAPGAHPGVILNGLGTVGKTTIGMHVGRKYESFIRKKLGLQEELPNGNLFIPVVYISLPGNVTIKAFNWLVADYFNIPTARGATEDWLTRNIIRTAKACGTSMFIVDDIHFVKVRNRSGEVINDHFKYLANTISATFVYAGINVEGTHLLSESPLKEEAVYSQTSHRFKKYEIAHYERNGDDYYRLLRSFESHLILVKQEPGALVRQLGRYIHDRTAGFIGAISTLLREGANEAIKTGDECLTESLLDKISLDHASEAQRRVGKELGGEAPANRRRDRPFPGR